MAANKYLKHNGSGLPQEQEATQTSAGAGDANKIIALDATGKIDTSLLPTGIAADTASIQASEALAAGDFVNIHDVGGAFRIRKADASTSGKEAHGFVLAAVSNGATGTVYFEGTNNQVTSVTPGVLFLSASTAGGFTSTAPTGAGKVVQRLGVGTTSTSINVETHPPIVLA